KRARRPACSTSPSRRGCACGGDPGASPCRPAARNCARQTQCPCGRPSGRRAAVHPRRRDRSPGKRRRPVTGPRWRLEVGPRVPYPFAAMKLAPETATAGVLGRIAVLVPILANAAGAVAVYLFFSYIDPVGPRPAGSGHAFALFVAITTVLLSTAAFLGDRWTSEVRRWSRRLVGGEGPGAGPPASHLGAPEPAPAQR